MKKIKTYYLTFSQWFPAHHPKAGEPTLFADKLWLATYRYPGPYNSSLLPKLHTIRANYAFWQKRFEKIAAGEAVLSVRHWVGKPYGKGSYQIEIMRLTREDGIGLQLLTFDKDSNGMISWNRFNIDGHYCEIQTVANNDGLSLDDWQSWFLNYDLSQPLAVIHFTKFRY